MASMKLPSAPMGDESCFVVKQNMIECVKWNHEFSQIYTNKFPIIPVIRGDILAHSESMRSLAYKQEKAHSSAPFLVI